MGSKSWLGELSLQDTMDTIAMLRCQYCVLGRDSVAGHLLLAGVRAALVVLCHVLELGRVLLFKHVNKPSCPSHDIVHVNTSHHFYHDQLDKSI